MPLPRNEIELEVSKLSVPDVLVQRVGGDATLIAAIRHLKASYGDRPVPRPFDGTDASGQIPIFVAEALFRVQKLLLELGSIRPSADGSVDPARVLAESKVRETDQMLKAALKASIDAHLFLAEELRMGPESRVSSRESQKGRGRL